MNRIQVLRLAGAFLVLGTVPAACAPSEPQTGSQTNWLRACDVSAECGPLSCICGACTRPCDDDEGCSNLDSASCVGAGEEGAVAVCGGVEYPSIGLCLPRCDEESCGDGAACVAGVCSPVAEADVEVTIDLDVAFQTLVGFGASLAYTEDEIAMHPRKEELFDVMFEDSGVDVIRLRNRYEVDNAGDLAAASEILSAAAERMGRAPITFLTSGSPPAFLKANDSKVCAGNLDTCTLVTLPGGGFDYAGFAQHWRDSLDAHAAAGITPDYLSIQNNPNWVPPESDPADACRFLPVEGTTTVVVDGVEVELAYPGFVEALTAVRTAIADLSAPPQLAVPEVSGVGALAEYAEVLDPAQFDVLSCHLYDLDPANVDETLISDAGAVAEEQGRPLFQSEMRADGMDTAILMQQALSLANVATYLQNDFAASASRAGGDDHALTSLEADTFTIEGPFHAVRHFARWTDPGWSRVAATVEAEDVLATAWVSPDADAVTVVLVNSGTTNQTVQLTFAADETYDGSEVTRTTFDGIERSASLGELPAEGIVELPARSILTVALTR